MNLAATIRKCRKLKNMTLREVALKAKISSSYVYLLETGSRNITVKSLEQVALALEIPLLAIILMASSDKDLGKLNKSVIDGLKVNSLELLLKTKEK